MQEDGMGSLYVAFEKLKQKLEEAKLTAQKYNYPQLNTAITSANEILVRTDVTETEVYDSISALRKAIKAAKATPGIFTAITNALLLKRGAPAARNRCVRLT